MQRRAAAEEKGDVLNYSDATWFGFRCLHRASVSPRHRAKYLRHATAYALAEIATD